MALTFGPGTSLYDLALFFAPIRGLTVGTRDPATLWDVKVDVLCDSSRYSEDEAWTFFEQLLEAFDVELNVEGNRGLIHRRGEPWEPRWRPRLIRSVTFSDDGTRVVTTGRRSVAVWDAQSGRLGQHNDGYHAPWHSPKLGLENRYVVSMVWKGFGSLLDLSSGMAFPLDGSGAVAFLGDRVATGSNGGRVDLCPPVAPPGSCDGLVAAVGVDAAHRALVPSDDGARLASVLDQGTVIVWDVGAPSGDNRTVVHHQTPVARVALGQRDPVLATATDDGTVTLWELSDEAVGRRLAVLVPPLHALDFSPDGRQLLAVDREGKARVWAVATRAELANAVHRGRLLYAAFTHSGPQVVTQLDDEVVVWNVAEGVRQRLPARRTKATAASLSPDGERVAIGYRNGTATIHEVSSGKVQTELIGPATSATR